MAVGTCFTGRNSAQPHHRPSIAEAEEAFYDPGDRSAPIWLAHLASAGDSQASVLLATLLQHCSVVLSKLAVAELCVVLGRGQQSGAGKRCDCIALALVQLKLAHKAGRAEAT